MRVRRPVQLLGVLWAGSGCAFISDDHAGWRADRDGDGVRWTQDCDESDKNIGAEREWYADADADGYGDLDAMKMACSQPEGFVSRPGDCNDQDPRVRPEVDDPCNAIDDDCDEEIDEDAESLTFYIDADGDGFGDPEQAMEACQQPDGAVADPTDCDDTNPDRFPGNVERCDELDNDCDGEVDNEALDPPIWYVDVDGDGFGDPELNAQGCEKPDGFVGNGDDCDDSDVQWQDRKEAEEYYNGLEDNCDPSDGDGDQDGDGFWAENYLELLEEGVAPMPIPEFKEGDCDDTDPEYNPAAIDFPGDGLDMNCDGFDLADSDGDGFDGILAGGDDCDDADPEVHPDATETCATSYDDDCDGVANERDADLCTNFYLDEDGDSFGIADDSQCLCEPEGLYTALTGIDCDDADSAVFPGADEVCFDDIDSDCDGEEDPPGCGPEEMAVVSLFGEHDLDGAGYSVGMTASGDLLVGAPGYDFGGIEEAGAVYVLPSLDLATLMLGGSGLRISGSETSGRLGTAVLGLADGHFAVSAPDAGVAGAVYIIWPTGESSVEVWDISTTYVMASDDCEFGASLASGKLLSDGREMLVIGGPSEEYSQIWVVDPALPALISTSDAHSRLYSTEWLEAGASVAVVDLDGDGSEDLLVGLTDYDAPAGGGEGGHGAIAVVQGPLDDGVVELESASSTLHRGLSGLDRLGSSIRVVGDIDGDSLDDVLVGADQAGSTSGEDDPGEVYLVTNLVTGGPGVHALSPYAVLRGVSAGDQTGAQVAISDVDGDGFDDIWISATHADDGGDDSGAVYLLLGPIDEGATIELADDADLVLAGEEGGEHFGQGLASVGDVDGDGMGDLLIGAPDASGGSGHVLLLLGADLPL